jgi:hypothetical protein
LKEAGGRRPPASVVNLPLSAPGDSIDGSISAERGQGVRQDASLRAQDSSIELPRQVTGSLQKKPFHLTPPDPLSADCNYQHADRGGEGVEGLGDGGSKAPPVPQEYASPCGFPEGSRTSECGAEGPRSEAERRRGQGWGSRCAIPISADC